MVSKRLLVVLVGMLAGVSPAVAQGSLATRPVSIEQCLDAGDARMGVMREIIECYTDELSRKDRVLNSTYRSVRAGLVSAKKQELQSLERRWLALRDRKCKGEADKEGGQDGTVVWYGCLIGETDKRIEWLKGFAR